MKARKATHGLDGQHQDVDRTLLGRVNQNDRGHEINGESTSTVWSTLGSRTAEEQHRISALGSGFNRYRVTVLGYGCSY